MESNGKRVTTSGEPLDYFVGEVDFGEPGTTGQHSFFQLMHMGQVALPLALPLTPTPTPTRTLTLLTWGRWSPPTS
eukprot:scaffold3317_cov80-Phaeocystis_antarctica.AAC.3